MKGFIGIGMTEVFAYHSEKHSHNFWEIVYYYEGNGIDTIDGTEYKYSPGTIICLPPMAEHEEISPLGYKNFWLWIKKPDINGTKPVVMQDTTNGDLLLIFKMLNHENHGENSFSIISPLLETLNGFFQRQMDSATVNPRINYLKNEIIDNLANPNFSIQKAMRATPVSSNYYRSMFKSEIKMSPKDFLQSIRIEHAKMLLENSTKPVHEICILCGYTDPYYFSRIFKKRCGYPPLVWRQRHS